MGSFIEDILKHGIQYKASHIKITTFSSTVLVVQYWRIKKKDEIPSKL